MDRNDLDSPYRWLFEHNMKYIAILIGVVLMPYYLIINVISFVITEYIPEWWDQLKIMINL